MTRLELLRKNYQRVCGLPWDRNLAGPQRVWLAVYDKEDERKLRLRLGTFAEATVQTGHRWQSLDLTDSFPGWLCSAGNAGYAPGYFESPELLDAAALRGFHDALVGRLRAALDGLAEAEETVLAVFGMASLFGFLKVSELLPQVETRVRGRLLVFFPGVHEQDNYRLLDARDGWNYLASPITPGEGDARK